MSEATRQWVVKVRNDRTGEVCVLTIEHSSPDDATQEGALVAFYELGWRSVTAMPAREAGEGAREQ